jgi:hypothetical protein
MIAITLARPRTFPENRNICLHDAPESSSKPKRTNHDLWKRRMPSLEKARFIEVILVQTDKNAGARKEAEALQKPEGRQSQIRIPFHTPARGSFP